MKTVTINIRSKIMNQLESYGDDTAVIVMHNARDESWYDDVKLPNVAFFYFNDELPIKKGFISQILTFFVKEEPQNIMTEQDAQKMIKFIRKNKEKDFVVGCEYGRGRSVAVARFLQEFYDYEVFNLPEDMGEREDVVNGNAWVSYLLRKVNKK